MYSFLKEEVFGARHQMTFIGQEMKIYLPKNYLEADSVFANNLGNKIETLGLFWFSVSNKMYELALPIKIQFEYQSRESFKGKLIPALPNLEYDVFILKNGDAFCYELNHKQDVDDLELMVLRVIDQGKLPQTVSYDESLEIFINSLTSSGFNTKLGVSSTILEIILAEMYRNKHNVAEPFRKLITTHSSASPYDFKLVRMSRLSGLNSIFTSLIGEDTYQQLANSIVRQREHIPDRPSPLEKLIKY